MWRGVLAGVLLLAACAPMAAGEPSPSFEPTPFEAWQVWDVKHNRPVEIESWLAGLASARVIYVGEEHRNRWHVEAALKILRSLLAHGLRPAIAMEMFGWDGQEALNRYFSDTPTTREQFLMESLWVESWGGPFEDYEPLVEFARDHRLPLLALNPPRVLVRLVAMEGLQRARQDERMARWGLRDEPLHDDEGYRSTVLDQLKRCHGAMSEDGYRRMYEAALFRDEGMAKIVADRLRGNPEGPATGPTLVYTGGGHIQYRLPVPNRVARRLHPAEPVRDVTVYLAALEPDRPEVIRELIRDKIADYVWLTPLSADGPPRRCT